MINEIEYNIENIAKEVLGNDFKFRENQLEIIAKIVRNCIEEKSNHQTHLVQAPTGTGKSIILIISALVLAECYNKKSFLLCSDLSLWKQYDDFIDSHEKLKHKIGRIKGSANYVCQKNNKEVNKGECKIAKISWKTLINPELADDCGYDCARWCPYIKARKQAMRSDITIMTYQMYFRAVAGHIEVNPNAWYVRPIVFCDECHNIPNLLQGSYCPQLRDTNLSKLLHIYDYAISLNNDMFADEWQEELSSLSTDIACSHNQLKDNLEALFNSIYECNDNTVLDRIKEYAYKISMFNGVVDKIIEKLSANIKGKGYVSSTEYEVYEECEWQKRHETMLKNYFNIVAVEENKDYVVVTPNEHTIEMFNHKTGKIAKKKEKTIDLQCAKEDYIAQAFLLQGPEHIVMTSATIGNMDSFSENLGIVDPLEDNLPSLFDFTNSPIYVLSRWKMSQKFKDESFPHVQSATYELCNRYNNKKGIIQTWTYDLAKKIYEEAPQDLKDRMLLYNDAKEKRDLIDYHKNTDSDTILVGPTLNEGIDLPGDECRFIIMIKMPYPYLGSRLVQRKKDLYDGWYQNETLRTIIQSIGRGVRYDGDWCQTYILDGSFSYFWFQSKSSFPLETQKRFKFYS